MRPPSEDLPALLGEGYAAIAGAVHGLDDATGDGATRAAGWTVRDLLLHLVGDAQRALVTMATPADAAPDTDAVTYWHGFRPDLGDGGAAHAAWVRRSAAAFTGVDGLVALWRDTSAAAARAVAAADPSSTVTTQGHVLTVRDVVSTLLVEATVHTLDLAPTLAVRPPPEALSHTRAVLERLLGAPLPDVWDDEEAVLRGTGRLPVDDERYPLLG
ncbi:maleylpyruvate isomerase N-terminal domain-containing protein [Nocardioides acrostichi]|uniref:Maleylpyruvate isomerase N-terminal domain-containing protein n=1 Tax=Nocardioides acrostichi TaxID=2784339 RepID=A0A930V0I0_9ACTN|nr:maleylpyruvate isomerase N-terminal domain-containing protein [Nocardioides acrostichi]MBF4161475.1 maleylpyruvate isomerase N-terminal domain-containing protein [Nocardioides acrostichi]